MFRILARLKALRGTRFDPFGYTDERRTERALITEFENLVSTLINRCDANSYDLVVEIIRAFQSIRGFGHVKAASIAEFRERLSELLIALDGKPDHSMTNAAE